MNPDLTWVLLRPDLTWHIFSQRAQDPHALYGRLALCGERSSECRLDVLAYTTIQPTAVGGAGPEHSVLCEACAAVLMAEQPAKLTIPSVMATIRPAA